MRGQRWHVASSPPALAPLHHENQRRTCTAHLRPSIPPVSHVQAYTHMLRHSCIQTHTHMHTYTHRHRHKQHTHTHTCTHTHVHACKLLVFRTLAISPAHCATRPRTCDGVGPALSSAGRAWPCACAPGVWYALPTPQPSPPLPLPRAAVPAAGDGLSTSGPGCSWCSKGADPRCLGGLPPPPPPSSTARGPWESKWGLGGPCES